MKGLFLHGAPGGWLACALIANSLVAHSAQAQEPNTPPGPTANPSAGGIGDLTVGVPGRVVTVIDGDTLILADGREIRMVGIQAPKLPLGRRNFTAWPLAEEAKAALSALVLERDVIPATGGAAMDRHGRVLAHLFLQARENEGAANSENVGTWIQGRLLQTGHARVYSFADNRARVAAMLALESEARIHKRGIWSHAFYRLRPADPDVLGALIGTFQLVEGTILSAARVKGRLYLNFGPDWRQDFTVMIERRDLNSFEARDQDPRAWEGARVRVRGWIEDQNGPMMEIDHPERIERLD